MVFSGKEDAFPVASDAHLVSATSVIEWSDFELMKYFICKDMSLIIECLKRK